MTSLDIYRQEIMESEKVRADFMKWKLMVGAIGGVGLGLYGADQHKNAENHIMLTSTYVSLR